MSLRRDRPFRIAHLHLEAGVPSVGVLTKTRLMQEAWRAAGVEVREFRPAVPSRHEVAGGRLGLVWAMERSVRALRRDLDRFEPDLVYARETVWTPAIEGLFARHPVVLELNGDPHLQLRRRSIAAATFRRLTVPRLYRRVVGVVGVTLELVNRFPMSDVRACVVGSPVEVAAVPPARHPSRPPRLVMLLGEADGEPVAPSRGLDRVAVLARALPEMTFVVHGGRAPASIPEVANLRFQPRVVGEELHAVLSEATACIGGLAPHRSGLRETRSLKIRTALAAGVPVVHAQPDPDLPGEDTFLLRLKSSDRTSDEEIERLRAFVTRVVDDEVSSKAAWRHACEHFSPEVTEARRLSFLRSLVPCRS